MAEDPAVYVPGDTITVDLGRITHYQIVTGIVALYETEDGAQFVLHGKPKDTRRGKEGGYPTFTSKAKVSAMVLADATPGQYELRGARVITFTGRNLDLRGDGLPRYLYLGEEPEDGPTL